MQILLFGTAVYNGSVWTFSDVSYAQLSANEGQMIKMQTEPYMTSPSIIRYTYDILTLFLFIYTSSVTVYPW